jgi:endogenous inhibitor of DNA gyrase (YacG/DUF329 family)
MIHNLKCLSCGGSLSGKQSKFCSNACKAKSSNNKHQNYKNQQRRGAYRKAKLMEMKGIKCSSCGYKKNYAALAFHHRDPSQKSFALDLRTCSNKSWESLLEEAAKCDLVCMNCHMEIHHPELDAESSRNKIKEFIQFNETEVNQHLLDPMNCDRCGKEYQPDKSKRKFCSEKCRQLNSRKVERPSREQLEKDLSEMSFVRVGKKYGVSDNAVRKWLKNY